MTSWRRPIWLMRLWCLAVFALVLFSSRALALGPGDQPPAIDLPDQHGNVVDLKKLKGKVVVVDFWASWCGPCKQEMPELEKLHKKYEGQGLVVVGVNIDRETKKMTKFLERMPTSFRIVHDKKLKVANRYVPPTMPSSYFIGRDGKISYVHRGFNKKDVGEIEKRIEALLGNAPESPQLE